MKCNLPDQKKLMSAYFTNELSGETLKKFQEHLFNCNACFEELLLKRKAINLIKEEGTVFLRKDIQKKEQRKRRIFSKIIWNQYWLDILTGWMLVNKNIVYSGITATLVIFFLVFQLGKPGNPEFISAIEYSETVPYSFAPGDFTRGNRSAQPESGRLKVFGNRFIQAMFSYNDFDYQNTINGLATLEPGAELLLQNQSDEIIVNQIAEYYFYLGVSHFALTKNTKITLQKDAENAHLKSAVNFLSRSLMLAQKGGVKSNNKFHYFLGMALGFSGEKVLAIEQLRMVKKEGQFFNQSTQLINYWSN